MASPLLVYPDGIFSEMMCGDLAVIIFPSIYQQSLGPIKVQIECHASDTVFTV